MSFLQYLKEQNEDEDSVFIDKKIKYTVQTAIQQYWKTINKTFSQSGSYSNEQNQQSEQLLEQVERFMLDSTKKYLAIWGDIDSGDSVKPVSQSYI